jgi:hypothetical protein
LISLVIALDSVFDMLPPEASGLMRPVIEPDASIGAERHAPASRDERPNHAAYQQFREPRRSRPIGFA